MIRTVTLLAQAREELLEALDGFASWRCSGVSLELVVLQIREGLHHEASARATTPGET